MLKSTIGVITGRQFATQFSLQSERYAWLLGAGSSASAGIPTGYMMIRDFKMKLFCQENELPTREVDSTDPIWEQRIREFIHTRSLLPSEDDPSEYSAAFEAVYPTRDQRRKYIEDAVRKGTPSFGHRVLASLITTKKIPCIFSTNFDDLVETSSALTDQLVEPANRAKLTISAIDSSERARRCMSQLAWPLMVKLHGDYQSLDIKNIDNELRTQDEVLRSVLSDACLQFGLIVVGYSGRDESVMNVLSEVLKSPDAYPAGLYWVTSSKNKLAFSVAALLNAISDAGVDTFIVESQNFDELAGDLTASIEFPKALQDHIFESRSEPILRQVPLPQKEVRKFPVLRCSAIPIGSLPTEARRLILDVSATTVEVRKLLKEKRIRAVVHSFGKSIAVFGHDQAVLNALSSLGPKISGLIELRPEEDSWALGLLYDALTNALCKNRPLRPLLRRLGHSIVVERDHLNDSEETKRDRRQLLEGLRRVYSSSLSGEIPKYEGRHFSEAIRIKLECDNGRWWCIFEPFTSVERPIDRIQTNDQTKIGRSFLPDPVEDWRRERWAQRYNQAWSNIIGEWSGILAGVDGASISSFGIPDNMGIDASFELSPITAWSRPSHQHEYFERSR